MWFPKDEKTGVQDLKKLLKSKSRSYLSSCGFIVSILEVWYAFEAQRFITLKNLP